MNALKALTVAGAMFALLSCGSEQKPIEITGAQAMGTVGGMVLSGVTREPITGATVTLLAGGVPSTFTTDATGAFTFPQVPSGEVSITIEKTDYLSAILHGTLLGAGEYPINNASLTFGPIGLMPSSGTFSALLLFDDGAPAGGISITARTNYSFYDYSGAATTSGSAQGRVFTADTDASGLVTFTGLPDFVLLGDGTNDWVTLVVPPIAAASGSPSMYRYPGGIFTYHMTAVAALTPTIVLEQPPMGQLAVVASTISVLEGATSNLVPSVVPKSGPLYIAFNQPLDPNATTVTLWDEGKGYPLELSKDQTSVVQQSISYNIIQLAFSPELMGSSEYNLVVHAVAGAGDQVVKYDNWAPFFTEPTASVLKPTLTREVVDAVNHVEVIHVTFAEPVGTGNPSTNVFQGNDCVLFFNTQLGDGDGGVGNDPGETGNINCIANAVNAFQSEEPDPPGLASTSGYTKYWRFQLPVAPGPTSLPAATPFSIVFSRISNPAYTMRRVNGETLPDFTGALNLVLP
jgi:hypothetical protein